MESDKHEQTSKNEISWKQMLLLIIIAYPLALLFYYSGLFDYFYHVVQACNADPFCL